MTIQLPEGKKLFRLQLWGATAGRPTDPDDGEFATHHSVLLDHVRGMADRIDGEAEAMPGGDDGMPWGHIARRSEVIAYWEITRVERPELDTSADTGDESGIYLDAIAVLLSGAEWSPDTLEAVANFVRESGRVVADVSAE